MFRVGFGYDVHQLAEGESLNLGGIHIVHNKGTVGHSDADVLLHAISDALLGSVALGDIGQHFPDNEEKYRNADSGLLLQKVYELVKDKGFVIGNIDCTVCLQKPKIAPHVPAIRESISTLLELEINDVSVKFTTTEKLGFIGREEGVSAYAVVGVTRVC